MPKVTDDEKSVKSKKAATSKAKSSSATKSKTSSNVLKTTTNSKISKTKTKAKSETKKVEKTATAKKGNKTSSAKTKTTSRRKKSLSVIPTNEYYDLPYRYNQTVVKVLAQTPTILFVYWDISDEDRNKYIENFGKDFFETTKPVLIVHNKTKNYTFEIDINDFANSWYIKTQEPDCDYVIELGRRKIESDYSNQYIHISSSNNITSPNNHVLFEKTNFSNIKFTNVKNNNISYKNFGSLRFINNIRKIYSKPEVSSLEEFLMENNINTNNKYKLNNPSSSFMKQNM